MLPESAPIQTATAAEAVVTRWSSSAGHLKWIVICLFVLVVTGIGVAAFRQRRLGAAEFLWNALFIPGQRTVFVASDTGLVMWEGATGKTVDLAAYLGQEYRTHTNSISPTNKIDPADLASRRYTSIVDLNIVKQLAQIAVKRHSQLDVIYARDVKPSDLKDSNIVLAGATAANPWIELYEPQMNFVFADAQFRRYTVVNCAPVGSEQTSWTSNIEDPTHRVYCVVTFLKNPNGKGNILEVAGTSTSGSECAWDFVNEDASFESLIKTIRRSDGSLPQFQTVLESTNLTGSSVQRKVVAWRVVNPGH